MDDPNKLQNDLKDAIRKSVLEVCSTHKIDDSQITYRLDLSVSLNIEDEIETQQGETDVGNN